MSIIKKITFIRHGECVSNVQKVFQSIGDTLTDIGTQQAQSWGSILADEAFDQVYTSTAVRTLQTLTYAISQ
jgi:broad specificity phosphatase PhoE